MDASDVTTKNMYLLEFREFVLTMKVLGWVPWVNKSVFVDGKYQLKVPLWAKAYCVVLLIVPFILNTVFMWVSLQMTSTFPSETKFFSYIFIFTSTFTNYIPCMVAMQYAGRAIFVYEWFVIQQQLEQRALTNCMEKIKMRFFNRVYLCFIFLSSLSFFGLRGFRPNFPDAWRALGFLNEQIVVYWMVYSTRFMKKACDCIQVEYKFLLELNESGHFAHDLGSVILSYRSILLSVSKKLDTCGNGVSLCISMSIIVNFIRCLYASFQVATTSKLENIPFWLPFFFYGFVPILTMCHYVHQVQESVKNTILTALEITKKMKVGHKEKTMMEIFLSRLPRLNPCINFNQYFQCDRRLLFVAMGALIADTVLLMQFNINHEDMGPAEYVMVSNNIHLAINRFFNQN